MGGTVVSNFAIWVTLGVIVCVISAIFHNSHKKSTVERSKELKKNSFGRHNISGVTCKNLDGTNRQTILKRCVRVLDGHLGRSIVFIAEKEPNNAIDPNAIRIYAEESWETARGDIKSKFVGFIGYIPKEVAKEITEFIANKEETVYIDIESPDIFVFKNEKGKDVIGISFEITAHWYAEPVEN